MNEATGSAFSLPTDELAGSVSPEVQRLAARMAQDAFARLFRLTLEGDEAAITAATAEVERLAHNWSCAAEGEEAQALRRALLLSGLDQWGLAYCQAFGLAAIPCISALLGALRARLDPAAEMRLQQNFAVIDREEGNAIDFKMELRRNIHLALWHAMIACEQKEEAQPILAALGGMLLALAKQLPTLGWRLVADTLAHIQMHCLMDAAASQGLAQEMTQMLFEVLRQSLPKEIFDPMMGHANQAVVAWQQSRRVH